MAQFRDFTSRSSQLENILDERSEGAWMARALDAERALTAEREKREAAERELANVRWARNQWRDQCEAQKQRIMELEARLALVTS